MLILSFKVNFAAKQLTEQVDFSEGGELDGLALAEVTAGLEDFGDVDFD